VLSIASEAEPGRAVDRWRWSDRGRRAAAVTAAATGQCDDARPGDQGETQRRLPA
jgi:hypothetical protein